MRSSWEVLARGTKVKVMTDKVKVWDLPVRLFHWLLVGCFTLAYLVAESERRAEMHVIAGYIATGLILFRVIWGLVGSRFARFNSFAFSPASVIEYLRHLRSSSQNYVGHTPAGSYAIYGLLLAGLLTGITGILLQNNIGGDSMEEVHEVCANVWLGLVAVHIAGVLVTSWIHRENLVRAMITGYKQNHTPPSQP